MPPPLSKFASKEFREWLNTSVLVLAVLGIVWVGGSKDKTLEQVVAATSDLAKISATQSVEIAVNRETGLANKEAINAIIRRLDVLQSQRH